MIIFASPAFLLGTEDYFPKHIIVTKYSLFGGKNQNSESTFISSTLKVEETKVSSEFQFSYLKHEY